MTDQPPQGNKPIALLKASNFCLSNSSPLMVSSPNICHLSGPINISYDLCLSLRSLSHFGRPTRPSHVTHVRQCLARLDPQKLPARSPQKFAKCSALLEPLSSDSQFQCVNHILFVVFQPDTTLDDYNDERDRSYLSSRRSSS